MHGAHPPGVLLSGYQLVPWPPAGFLHRYQVVERCYPDGVAVDIDDLAAGFSARSAATPRPGRRCPASQPRREREVVAVLQQVRVEPESAVARPRARRRVEGVQHRREPLEILALPVTDDVQVEGS